MKKVIVILLVAVMAVGAAACQETPEEVIVVKKDAERMIEQAGAEENSAALSELGIPDGRAVYETTQLDGMLKITVDAEVKKPNADAMPIVKVSRGLFAQEQVTGMFNYLFPGEKPKIKQGQVETKADIEQYIIQLKKQYADGEFNGSEEEYNAQLASLNKIYKEAPESAPTDGDVSDGTMYPFAGCMSLTVENENFMMSVHTPVSLSDISNGASGAANLIYSCKNSERIYADRNAVPTDGRNLSEAAENSLTISYDEAKGLCDGFFAAAGYPNGEYQVGAAFVVDDTGADEIPGENYAYEFLYTHITGGIPSFFDDEYRLGCTSTNIENSGFSVPWGYEFIQFHVDDEGIAGIEWREVIKTGDIVTESAALKPFDDIMSVFSGMMTATYSTIVKDTLGGEISLDIKVDKAELTMLRIREQSGDQTTGLSVPAWIFYGYNKGTDKDGEVRYLGNAASIAYIMNPYDTIAGEPQDMAAGIAIPQGTADKFRTYFSGIKKESVLLVINAIDGTIIDLSEGY